jgi:hypothetical protein
MTASIVLVREGCGDSWVAHRYFMETVFEHAASSSIQDGAVSYATTQQYAARKFA